MIVTPSLILQVLVNGLMIAGIYALVAVGLSIILGVLKVINFAHGEFLMIGMYIAYWSVVLLGIHPYLSGLIVLPVLFLLGLVVERILIEPVLKAPVLNQLLITAGLSIFLQNIALLFWRADPRTITVPSSSINLFGILISEHRFYAFVFALAGLLILYYLLLHTRVGKKIRAVAQDLETAEIMGINSRYIRLLTFGLGSALVGVASFLMIPIFFVYPTAGLGFGLIAWIVIVLGGLGSFEGALLGSFIIGITEAFVAFFINIEMARAAVFVIFLLILFIKPSGILGGRARV